MLYSCTHVAPLGVKGLIVLFVLYVVSQDTDNLWWDSFATDFFEDDATLTLTFGLEDGPKRYSKCVLNTRHYTAILHMAHSVLMCLLPILVECICPK